MLLLSMLLHSSALLLLPSFVFVCTLVVVSRRVVLFSRAFAFLVLLAVRPYVSQIRVQQAAAPAQRTNQRNNRRRTTERRGNSQARTATTKGRHAAVQGARRRGAVQRNCAPSGRCQRDPFDAVCESAMSHGFRLARGERILALTTRLSSSLPPPCPLFVATAALRPAVALPLASHVVRSVRPSARLRMSTATMTQSKTASNKKKSGADSKSGVMTGPSLMRSFKPKSAGRPVSAKQHG